MISHKLVSNVGSENPKIANLRCPHCNHVGAFHGLPQCSDVTWTIPKQQPNGARVAIQCSGGIRICPNPSCRCLVHVVLEGSSVFESFPPEVIDFDSTNLPAPILASLEEAIKAHSASCYKACALMVRRVLEELCDDKNATGGDLKSRLAVLGQSALVPKDLLDAADELRLLGNDAAHIKAKNYDGIGKDEAALAIELAKELLKAVYQYTSLVSKLKALKKS